MSYPVKYRERVVEYRHEGHTYAETKETFKVAISTICKWEKQLKETGNLGNKPLNRKPKKINPERLKGYVAANPTAYQYEVAKEFGCSKSAIQKAYKRLGITRKKGLYTTRSRMKRR